MGNSIRTAQFLIESRLSDAARGNGQALFDLGMAYSTGHGDIAVDYIEAHKWFNLAALAGIEEAQYLRAEVSEEMTAREIAEAQRQARAWVAATSRAAA